MVGLLERTVREKDRFEYQGYVATIKEAESLFAKAERLGTWAESLITTR